MQERPNRRRAKENFVQFEHLKLIDLRERARGLDNIYLFNENIPDYPRPELHVTHLKHDTERGGLRGIRRDGGFRNPYFRRDGGFRNPGLRMDGGFRNPRLDSLVYWSLAVGPDDIQAAERRLLEETFPDRTEEQVQRQQSFLGHFATSPAFDQRSRYGSYRFTFPLEEILKAYREQFCSGQQPVMRVYKTVLYKQEVMYVVLVHSPDADQQFSLYPLLADGPDSICSYRDGCFIWRPEAMCETHSYQLVEDEMQMAAVKVDNSETASRRSKFYVWDHVALALHVDDEVLKFDADQLRKNLKFCDKTKIPSVPRSIFDDFKTANRLVEELWPDCPYPLERVSPLNQELHQTDEYDSKSDLK